MGATSSKAVSTPTEKDLLQQRAQNEPINEFVASMDSMTLSAPQSLDGSLGEANLREWEAAAAQDTQVQLARTFLCHTDITTALLSRKAQINDQHVFSHKLPFSAGGVTNQHSSGRCWIFSTTNVIRYNVAKALQLENFELSQSYLFFYDKLEKANYYLELSIQHADLPGDDRLITHLATDPVGDGGQWDMSVNLLKRYGVVPQAIFPESYSSSNSGRLNQIVTVKLREHALTLRSLYAHLQKSQAFAHLDSAAREEKILTALRQKKETLVAEIWKILSITLGEPPKASDKFTYEYYTVKGEYKSWTGTPIEFYQAFSSKQYPHTEAFSLINDPRNEYSTLFSVEKLGNIWNGHPVRYVNTTSQKLKEAVITTIKAGQPVFFGCDVGKSSVTKFGLMDTELYDLPNAFGIDFVLNKADRLRTGESAMTHAMVISAVHLDAKGNPVRYRVENSWGPDVGDKGFFVMTDAWFDEYVLQVVVPRQLAAAEHIEVLDGGKAVSLPPWDPMGALA